MVEGVARKHELAGRDADRLAGVLKLRRQTESESKRHTGVMEHKRSGGNSINIRRDGAQPRHPTLL